MIFTNDEKMFVEKRKCNNLKEEKLTAILNNEENRSDYEMNDISERDKFELSNPVVNNTTQEKDSTDGGVLVGRAMLNRMKGEIENNQKARQQLFLDPQLWQ